MDYMIIVGCQSDMELTEDTMIINVNPLEIMELAYRCRQFLKKEESISGRVLIGYEFNMRIVEGPTPNEARLFYPLTDRHEPDTYEETEWRVECQRVAVTNDKILAHAYAKGTNSYFESDDLEPELRRLADEQLGRRLTRPIAPETE